MQSGGLRAPAAVPSGGTIPVDVGTPGGILDVHAPGGPVARVPVKPGRTARIPVPPVPPGTVLLLTVGTGANRRIVLVEVVEAE